MTTPKKMGRPLGSCKPSTEQTKPRSVRLNNARWEKLQHLGRNWLEDKIDRAKPPADAAL